MRYFEYLKDYFVETNQHGRMEEKASVEAEVPYVFQNDHMCLIAGHSWHMVRIAEYCPIF